MNHWENNDLCFYKTGYFDVGRIFSSDLENLTCKIFRGNITVAAGVSYATAFKARQKLLQSEPDTPNIKFTEIAAAGNRQPDIPKNMTRWLACFGIAGMKGTMEELNPEKYDH